VPPPLGPESMGVEAMVIAGHRRVTLPPDAPKRAFVAYSGPYTFDGTRLRTHKRAGLTVP
jgi:hypothetical protein